MIHVFDGAQGTMLQAAGVLNPGDCPELLNITHPEAIATIIRAYVEAGSDHVETCTFGASAIKLEHYGLSDRVREINIAAVKVAKEAAQGRAKVVGGMGPSGRFIEPLGDLSFEKAYANFYEQASALAEGGADYILIETCIDMQEMRAALLAAKDATSLPVICQLSFSEDGRTVTGTDPETAAITLDAMGADIIGMNCSLGPEQLIPVLKAMAKVTDKPLSVQPNAGMPRFEKGKTRFPMSAEDFGYWAPKLVEAGANYVGGCCGTTPDHIRAIAQAVKGLEPVARPERPVRLALTSRSKTVYIDKDLPTVLIGERINPTGRKKLAAEIKEGSFLTVKKDALNQVKAGAKVLDVNMGVAGIDQAEAMSYAINEIAQITDTPLAIDTSDAKALEAGLRAYPGRALINSVSAEPDRIREFLPLAKKYGAAILCLPITAEGICKTAEERVAAIGTIVDAAKEQGLKDGDFLLDGLVMTIAADANAAQETFKTLRMYREQFGYPSTMGLSNISFGLPNRPLINSTFFTMCLLSGLDAPIMNPYDELMQNALMASAALIGKDPCAQSYSRNASNLAASNKAAVAKEVQLDTISAIKAAVIDGDKDGIGELVVKAISEGKNTNDITEHALTAAMNEIGIDFGSGKVFLPQVLLSAEAMRAAFLKIKELLPATVDNSIGTVVLATVKGDVHDLGKNIVGALLSNSGFKLIDLGKDVDSQTIVRAAIENEADIVGLCALMTTTMTQIDTVVAELKEAGCGAKVMVGGAAVTEDYAQEAGADAYAPDGVAAVKLAKVIIGK